MRFQLSTLVVASAALLSVCRAFSVQTSGAANALAGAIFGQGITVLHASYSGASDASGLFTDGPFGIGNAAILTSGSAVGALPGGDHFVDNGAPGSDQYCNTGTYNAAILTADVIVSAGFTGVTFEIILASEERGGSADPIGIFVDNQNYALDGNGNRITATSPYLAQPLVITPPNSVTSYPGSSPPLLIDVAFTGPQTVVIAICDVGDTEWDSALLIKAEACSDCGNPVRLAYVTTTTTLPAGEAEFTSTTTASGTVSGTIRIGVTADETTTTEEPTTTTTADETTTTEEPTTTTTVEESTTATEDSTTTTQETTTVAENTTTATTTEETTTSSAEETTTTTQESSTEASIDESTTTTAPDLTSGTTTEVSTEPSSTVTSTEEPPEASETTTDLTTVNTSGTTAEPSIISTEITTGQSSDVTTTTDSSTEITTGTETIDSSDIPSDSTTISSDEVVTPLSSSAISTALTSAEGSTPSLSSDVSSESLEIMSSAQTTAQESSSASTAIPSSILTVDPVPNPGSITTTSESRESTVSQSIESFSTDIVSPSFSGIVVESSSGGGVESPSISTLSYPPVTDSLLTSSTETISDSPFSSVVTSTVEDSQTPATPTYSTTSTIPSNLAVIGTFRYFGCLGSTAGYPSFELVAEGEDMTTVECARLTRGRAYMGLYLRSCYAADTLDSAATVRDGRCDLPCPGEPGLFCGGLVDSTLEPRPKRGRGLSRRDAPPDVLLTLYAEIEAVSGSLSASDAISTSEAASIDASSAASALPVSTDGSLLPGLTTGSSGLPIANPTSSLLPSNSQALEPIDASSTRSLLDPIITLDPSVPGTKSPGGNPVIPPFPTISYNAGNFTRTEALAPIITTIVYTIVDPNDPSYLTVTEFCATLRSPPCRNCQYQKPPMVEMTTIQVDCNACGRHGENSIVLDIPAGALLASPTRDHAIHQTDQVLYHRPNTDAQKGQPDEKARPQGDSPALQKPRPQEPEPETDDEPYEDGESHKSDEPHKADEPYNVDEPYEFDQPETHNARPTAVGDSHEQDEPIADVSPVIPAKETNPAPKSKPLGGNDQPEPPRDSYHRRPVPVSTPVVQTLPPDTSIVIVSGGVLKVMDGVLMMLFLMTGLIFLL